MKKYPVRIFFCFVVIGVVNCTVERIDRFQNSRQSVVGYLGEFNPSFLGIDKSSVCRADQIQAIDSKGDILLGDMQNDCFFTITLEAHKSYILNFLLHGEKLARLSFISGISEFSTSIFFIKENQKTINLGEVTISGNIGLPSINPLKTIDRDGDGIADLDDMDDDGDGILDQEEPDCDLDSFPDDQDEDSQCQDVKSDYARVFAVRPINNKETYIAKEVVLLSKKVRIRVGCAIDSTSVTNKTFRVNSSEPIQCAFRFSQIGATQTDISCVHDNKLFAADTIYTAHVEGLRCIDGTPVESLEWHWRTGIQTNDNIDYEDQLDEKDEVDFLSFGDWGSGTKNQKKVAQAMKTYCIQNRCDFLVALGDNFYEYGVTSIDDPQWRKKYTEIYGEMNIPFYPLLGNHDLDGNFQAQIDYSAVDPSWRMEGEYYSVKRSDSRDQPLLEIFLFTDYQFDATAQEWLRNAIALSKAQWKILAKHVPIISNGIHGDDELSIKSSLLPMICNSIDIVLSGHDHIFSYLRDTIDDCSIDQIIIGTGGAELHTIDSIDTRVISSESTHGFGWFKVNNKSLRFTMVRSDGKIIYSTEWKK